MKLDQEHPSLNINKPESLNLNQEPLYEAESSHLSSQPFSHKFGNINSNIMCAQSQMTPPVTPFCSQEDLHHVSERTILTFHSFLRAFCPFNPLNKLPDQTITLPLNDGDIILVHSIHKNGWADGTILSTGARGWLPTNYCRSFYPGPMQKLLDGLLKFCELLQNFTLSKNKSLPNHEFMRGMISGVRFLLEETSCLKKESILIRDCDILRRTRKSLLFDLSALVKNAKSLYQLVGTSSSINTVESYVDGMTLMAFKVTTHGVLFLDLWKRRINQTPMDLNLSTSNFMPLMTHSEYRIPPSPPADISHNDSFPFMDLFASSKPSRVMSSSSFPAYQSISIAEHEQNIRSLHRTTTIPRSQGLIRKKSSSRLFLNNTWQQDLSVVPESSSSNICLVSEKLVANHDTLLSFLGSFIGKLHLHTQSSADLIHVVHQFVTVGRELLHTVEMICDRDPESAHTLYTSKNVVEYKFQHLIVDAEEIIQSSGDDEESIVLPEQKASLLTASSGCVRAAGECVAKTILFLDQIGDFEYTDSSRDLNQDLRLGFKSPRYRVDSISSTNLVKEPHKPPPPPIDCSFTHKSFLTETPQYSNQIDKNEDLSPIATPDISCDFSIDSESHKISPGEFKCSEQITHEDSGNCTAADPTSNENNPFSLTPASSMESSLDEENMDIFEEEKSRKQSIDTVCSYATSHSEFIMAQENCTPNVQVQKSDNLHCEKISEEVTHIEKTYVHELLYNKEGALIGGSLKALVEQLTIHNSTPDSLFVSTFYLTFRLFVAPLDLAIALIERFDSVSEDPNLANHVHLRVYNVFKGWLESNWREAVDHSALSLIESFAKEKLEKALPGVGIRLKDLVAKVSSSQRPLVPRTKSLIGKSSVSSAQYAPSDATHPPPVLNRSASMILRNWKVGSAIPTILDFDPLEFARQLTIKGMDIFCSILPEELLDSQWTKRSDSCAANVRAMAALSTDLSTLVTDSVLQQDDVKKRALVVKQWIKIAQKCLELNNYDSLMAIICAMNSSSVTRLKKTWDAVSQRRKEILKSLQTIVEPEKNYAVLRRRLHDHVPPCLPFVGLFLTDLTFVNAGNPSTRHLLTKDNPEGLQVINFDKHTRTAKIIFDLQRFQFNYRLTKLPELQDWMQTEIDRLRTHSESELVQSLYRKSLLLEPRENQIPSRNPSDGHLNLSKEKFDIFAWATRERSTSFNHPAASFP